MKIIPAIDIIDGKCVRLFQGDYQQQKTYSETPATMAKYFAECGVDKIHVVDLDGAKQKKLVNTATIREICQQVAIPVEVGGGIRSREDIIELQKLGVSQMIIGSLAIQQPDVLRQFLQEFGPDKILVGIDAKDGRPKISGWQQNTDITVDELMQQMAQWQVGTVIYTDISRDGTLTSPNFAMYEKLVREYPSIEIVASGGVSSEEDIDKLRELGVSGVILGKSIYENKLDLCNVSQKNHSLS